MLHDGIHVAEVAVIDEEGRVRGAALHDVAADADAVDDGERRVVLLPHHLRHTQRVAHRVVGSHHARGVAGPTIVISDHMEAELRVEGDNRVVAVAELRDAYRSAWRGVTTCVRRRHQHALRVQRAPCGGPEHDGGDVFAVASAHVVDGCVALAELRVRKRREANETTLHHGEGHVEGVLVAQDGCDVGPEAGIVKEGVEVGDRRRTCQLRVHLHEREEA